MRIFALTLSLMVFITIALTPASFASPLITETTSDSIIFPEKNVAELEKDIEEKDAAQDKSIAEEITDQKVIKMIDVLEVNALTDREAVVLARQYYSKLNKAQKALVTNVQQLEKAEAQIVELWIDSAEVSSPVNEGLVGVLRDKYNELSTEQKAYVHNADKLDELEAKLMQLRTVKEDNFVKAKQVEAIIDQMQVLKYSDKSEAVKARVAYDALTADQKAFVTNYSLLKEAENRVAGWEGKTLPHKAPDNIIYAGTRSSDYGVSGQWLGTNDWQQITDQMKGYFPSAQPTYVWIIGRLDGDVGIGGTKLEFEQPNDGVDYSALNISFGSPTKTGHLSHEDYLNYFDKQGIKVFLQVESGFADMDKLMDLIFTKYGHHPSVAGFGVDVEWYYGVSEDAGLPVTDTLAKDWDEHLKQINPTYRMFLKHYSTSWLPPTYRSDILFCDDSQSIGSIDGEVPGMYDDTMGFIPEFKAFADYFAPNDVLYQIGYRPDAMWYYTLNKPVIQSLGERLAEVTSQNMGITWVDFTIKDPLTFPALFKTDKEVTNAVNTLVSYLRGTGNNMVGKRFAANEATLTDAMYVARVREVVNSLTESQRGLLNQGYLANLISLEPKALDIRLTKLDYSKLRIKDKAKVADIRTAYTALTTDQKAQVTMLNNLVSAESALAAIKDEDDTHSGGGNTGGGNTGGGNSGGSTPGTDSPSSSSSSSGSGKTPSNTNTPTIAVKGEGSGTANGSTGVVLTDIQNHWAVSSIEQAVKFGFINGYEDGTFRPNSPVTRSDLVTMLSRALHLEDDGMRLTFADQGEIPIWAKPFVERVVKAGIINGYEDHTFRPSQQVNRLEATVMMVRALGLKPDSDAVLSFSDADQVPAWAAPYVVTAIKAGVIQGKGGSNIFAPRENATRAEVVIMLLAMLKVKG